MIENLTLYLPIAKPEFKTAFPSGKSKGGFFKPSKEYSFQTNIGSCVLVPFKDSEISAHLEGFQGYVMQLGNQTPDKWKAIGQILETKSVIGVTLPSPISEDSNLFNQLKQFTFKANGFIFVNDSILTADGYLVGPASIDETDPNRMKMRKIREDNILQLKKLGFLPARNLPIGNMRKLRPTADILKRLNALSVLVTYVGAPEDKVPEETLRKVFKKEELDTGLTPEEHEIFSTPRHAVWDKYGNGIGWKVENMWPLAWILGFNDIPTIQSDMLQGEKFRAVIRFAEDTTTLNSVKLRNLDQVIELEDLFYCVHNAVRSAQQGATTVPEKYDPIMDGGLVHERRHALSWALSGDRSWDDTDLST